MPKNKITKSSVVDFLIYAANGETDVEVRISDDTIWLSQLQIAELFDVSVKTANEHLLNIFNSGELERDRTIRKFRIVRSEGEREVRREIEFYNFDAIISVGYRVNSVRATHFRKWATGVLRDFALRGYVLDKERLKNGGVFTKKYFDELISEIREIRSSERNFYQKITDIYSTAVDYDSNSEITRTFFAMVQNKMHFAIHGHTAAEVIMERADSTKERMGLNSWKNAPDGRIIKSDVSIAKNYLTEKELKSLDRIVTMYLDYAETQAEKEIPMTMENWSQKLNAFLQFNEKEILHDAGRVTQAVAKAFAESEFEKYRKIQDKLFESDFDIFVKAIEEK